MEAYDESQNIDSCLVFGIACLDEEGIAVLGSYENAAKVTVELSNEHVIADKIGSLRLGAS